MTRWMPSGTCVPSNGPLCTITPGPSYASVMSSERISSSGGWMTTLIGRPYSFANSKSRWSCAGTAITAPVPYSISA